MSGSEPPRLIAVFGRQIFYRLLSGPQHGHIHLWRGRFPRYSLVVGLLFISHVFLRRRVDPSLRDPVRVESHLHGKRQRGVVDSTDQRLKSGAKKQDGGKRRLFAELRFPKKAP